MLTAHRAGTLSPDYLIYRDGEFVIRWDTRWMRRHEAAFDLRGRPYRVSRSLTDASGAGPHFAWLHGPDGDSVLAQYENDEAWAITVSDRRYWIRRTSFFGRDIDLVWDDQVAGSVRFAGRFRKVVTAHLPAELSLAAQLFVVGWALK